MFVRMWRAIGCSTHGISVSQPKPFSRSVASSLYTCYDEGRCMRRCIECCYSLHHMMDMQTPRSQPLDLLARVRQRQSQSLHNIFLAGL